MFSTHIFYSILVQVKALLIIIPMLNQFLLHGKIIIFSETYPDIIMGNLSLRLLEVLSAPLMAKLFTLSSHGDHSIE